MTNQQACTDCLTRVTIIFGFVVGLALAVPPANAVPMDCSTTEELTAPDTIVDDYETDSTSLPCFTIDGSGVVDFNNHVIKCETSSGCANAIEIISDDVEIRNLKIECGNEAGECFNVGIYNYDGSNHFPGTILFKVFIDGANYGMFAPGEKIQQSGFTNINDACTATYLIAAPAGGTIVDSYCQSADVGWSLIGPTSGAFTIADTYVNAVNEGIAAAGTTGSVDITRSIIAITGANGTPFSGNAADPGTGANKNICDDETDCPRPGPNFSLAVETQ